MKATSTKYDREKMVISTMIMAIFLLISCGARKEEGGRNRELLELYEEIDYEISRANEYEEKKEQRINKIKRQLRRTDNEIERLQLTDQLINEYEAFKSDSALYYINLNLQSPLVKSDNRLELIQLIKKADVAAHAGLFGEASEILGALPKNQMDSSTLEKYYSAYCDLYQYQSEYATDSEYAAEHARLREAYIDSVSMVSDPTSMTFIVNKAASRVRSGKYEEAENLLLNKIGDYQSGERDFSILASILADLYKQKGDGESYAKYIALSALSDLRGAVKENMAIRALAMECFEEGDLERADLYLRQSFADANFYSARMRNAQSSRILPIIGEAYTTHQKSLNAKLRLLVIFISILAFGFIVISVFAFLQVKKIRKINKKTKGMLDEVSALSIKLGELNKELSETNAQLQTSNKIQSEYGVLFMEYCSMAITALQRYQQSLKVAAAQGNRENLLKKIESGAIENKTLAEFYNKFDEAILNLYPDFVEKINELLRPEDRITLKPKESLNTELRVVALTRIGIADAEKIAKFLRCSLSTVYTYRSKLKKKAIDMEKFEEQIMYI